jgi:hypothetical protein
VIGIRGGFGGWRRKRRKEGGRGARGGALRLMAGKRRRNL